MGKRHITFETIDNLITKLQLSLHYLYKIGCVLSSFDLQSGAYWYIILIDKHHPRGKGLEDETLQYTYLRETLNSLMVSIASN